jgi:hypothetical protein
MTDLTPVPYAINAAVVYECGHVQELSPQGVRRFRRLILGRAQMICQRCPTNDNARFIIDVIVRHD